MGSQHHKRSAVYSQNTSKPTKGSSTALTAVAIQDHMMRNLSLVDPFKKAKHKPPPAKKPPRNIKPIVDTRRHAQLSKGSKKSETEKEYVLDPKPKPLSLAQKMGLVEAPEQPLSENEWARVKDKSNKRDDSVQPCVICKEDFGTEQQVLLSCSHVFHRNCLQAFERFTGRKTCPMCRKQEYQTRVIHEGARYHRQKCATRIQSCWRGYVVRSWYKKLRETVPPRDPNLRKKFYEGKLQAITDRLVRSYDVGVDAFLSQIDRSVAESRNVFRRLEASPALAAIAEDEWERIQLKAVERGEKDCPICIMSLGNIAEGNEEVDSPRRGQRKTVLLSCTHVFHLCCLQAFEELSLGEHKICPVCRSGYQKRVLQES
ncbi:RING finger protein 32-like [Diadema antillarum]|uniref:RING finger protein 32-like n=1 Tax=Diadema antillarum TaxID=105358 RepID=UPI003A83B19A